MLKRRIFLTAIPLLLLCFNSAVNSAVTPRTSTPIPLQSTNFSCKDANIKDSSTGQSVRWVDSDGDSCCRYNKSPHWCDDATRYANVGYDATDVCCVCGGGEESQTVEAYDAYCGNTSVANPNGGATTSAATVGTTARPATSSIAISTESTSVLAASSQTPSTTPSHEATSSQMIPSTTPARETACSSGSSPSGSGACASCVPGKFKNTYGSEACLSCAGGKYSMAGATHCAECETNPPTLIMPSVATCSGSCACESSMKSSVAAGVSQGTITDGEGDYANNARCEWLFQGTWISLFFSSFDVEWGFDLVDIWRCRTPACEERETLAHFAQGPIEAGTTFNSTTGYLKVVFTSDGYVRRAGFVGNWTIYSPCVAEPTSTTAEQTETVKSTFSKTALESTPLPDGSGDRTYLDGGGEEGEEYGGSWSGAAGANSGWYVGADGEEGTGFEGEGWGGGGGSGSAGGGSLAGFDGDDGGIGSGGVVWSGLGSGSLLGADGPSGSAGAGDGWQEDDESSWRTGSASGSGQGLAGGEAGDDGRERISSTTTPEPSSYRAPFTNPTTSTAARPGSSTGAQSTSSSTPIPTTAPAPAYDSADSDGDGRLSAMEVEWYKSTYGGTGGFWWMDCDADGSVSRAELAVWTRSLESADADGDGFLNPAELAQFQRVYLTGGSFASIDTDGDGAISTAEFGAYGVSLTAADRDEDGLISPEEFAHYKVIFGGNASLEAIDMNADDVLSAVEFQAYTTARALEAPRMLSPAAALWVASGAQGEYAHIWQAGTSGAALSGEINVSLRIAEPRHAEIDLQVRLRFEGQAHGHAVSYLILGVSEDGNLTLSIKLPAFSAEAFPCQAPPCSGRMDFSIPASVCPVALPLSYFEYPDPELVSISPDDGFVDDETVVLVQVRDFMGEKTRHGAGMFSFHDLLEPQIRAYMTVRCRDGEDGNQEISGKLLDYERRGKETIFNLQFGIAAASCGEGAATLNFLFKRHACPCFCADVSWSASDMFVAGLDLTSRTTLYIFSDYPDDYMGCRMIVGQGLGESSQWSRSGNLHLGAGSGAGSGEDAAGVAWYEDDKCGSLVETALGLTTTVAAGTWYLGLFEVQGYYTQYSTFYVEVGGVSVDVSMVQEMESKQERVVLSWSHEQDLDLWVYTPDRTGFVGWDLDDPRSDTLAGGTVALDVDSIAGDEGPETTSFLDLEAGVVEVWVNHYDDQFTYEEVSASPASVQVFCQRCLDDTGAVKEGYVTTVVQRAAEVPAGGGVWNWWKVGFFTFPASCYDYASAQQSDAADAERFDRLLHACLEDPPDSERVRWTTCQQNCYTESAEARLFSWEAISWTATDMLDAGNDLTALAAYEVYDGYPTEYVGCSGTQCGRLVDSGEGGEANANLRAGASYLLVLQAPGYYPKYTVVYVEVGGVSVDVSMVQEMESKQERVVLSWSHEQDLDLWVYTPDRTGFVGWDLDDPRSDTLAGGTVALDVDSIAGDEGPETTSFLDLEAGVVEVWVNHYDDQFTYEEVSASPASVQVFCQRCLDDTGAVKEGYVTTVVQRAAEVPADGGVWNWWKVGSFSAPSGAERMRWTTCASECYKSAGQADLNASAAGSRRFIASSYQAFKDQNTSLACSWRQKVSGVAATFHFQLPALNLPPVSFLPTDVIIRFVILLPMPVADFTMARQTRLRRSIADAARVSPAKVRIASFEAVVLQRRRQLLADGTKVAVEVAAQDASAAQATGELLTAASINQQLAKTGLPQAEILEPADPASPATTSTAADAAGEDLSLQTIALAPVEQGFSPIFIAAAALGGLAAGALIVLSCLRAQKRRGWSPKFDPDAPHVDAKLVFATLPDTSAPRAVDQEDERVMEPVSEEKGGIQPLSVEPVYVEPIQFAPWVLDAGRFLMRARGLTRENDEIPVIADSSNAAGWAPEKSFAQAYHKALPQHSADGSGEGPLAGQNDLLMMLSPPRMLDGARSLRQGTRVAEAEALAVPDSSALTDDARHPSPRLAPSPLAAKLVDA